MLLATAKGLVSIMRPTLGQGDLAGSCRGDRDRPSFRTGLQHVAGEGLIVSEVLQRRSRGVFERPAFETLDESLRVPLTGPRDESVWVDHFDLVLEPDKRLDDYPHPGDLMEDALKVLLSLMHPPSEAVPGPIVSDAQKELAIDYDRCGMTQDSPKVAQVPVLIVQADV